MVFYGLHLVLPNLCNFGFRQVLEAWNYGVISTSNSAPTSTPVMLDSSSIFALSTVFIGGLLMVICSLYCIIANYSNASFIVTVLTAVAIFLAMMSVGDYLDRGELMLSTIIAFFISVGVVACLVGGIILLARRHSA